MNNTQSSPDTANPQNVGTSAPVNSGEDFQKTAAPEELNNQRDGLTVETTGEPLPAGTAVSSSSAATWLWVAGFVALMIVIVYIARLMIADDEGKLGASKPAAKPAARKKAASTATAKKTTAKKTKSGKPVAKKKKTTKKRR